MTQNINAGVNAYGAEKAVLQTPAGTDIPVRPDGYLRVSNEPTALFAETFDSATIDVVDKWTALGTTPTDANGVLTVDPGATALALSGLRSKVTFALLGNMFNQSVFIVKIDAAAKTGNYRCWGQASPATSPTSTAPVVNGVLFELDPTTGALSGSVWSGGVETQTVNLTRPTDGEWHRYAIYYKTSRVYFEIDGNVVGSIAYPAPAWSNLPLLILSVNGGSTVSPAAVLQSSFIGIGDTSGNATMISDGTNPYRKAKVGQFGDLSISITNPLAAAANLSAGVTSYGFLRTTVEPHALFNDTFDAGTLDTTNRWVTTGSTVQPTIANGRLALAPGATLSAATQATSQGTFVNVGINFVAFGCVAQFESVNSTPGTLFYLNSHRFLGYGTVPTTWTTAYTASASSGPLLNAIGFEIDIDGKMYPVVYSAGVRVRPTLTFGGADIATGHGAATSATAPGGTRALADGNLHSFGIAFRSDVFYWYVDGSDLPVAIYSYRTAGFQPPDVQQLPLRFHTINSGVAPSGTMVNRVGAIGVADTGSNHSQIADCNYPWRKATVTKTGGLSTIPGPSTLPSYIAVGETSTGAFGSNVRKDYLSIEHSAASTKTIRIRRITIGGYQTGSVAGFMYAKVFHGTAATTAGTVQAATKTNEASVAAEAVVKILPTITANTVKVSQPIGSFPATANTGVGPVTVYDSTSGADQEPLTLRAGVLEALSVALYSTQANTVIPSVCVYFTEE